VAPETGEVREGLGVGHLQVTDGIPRRGGEGPRRDHAGARSLGETRLATGALVEERVARDVERVDPTDGETLHGDRPPVCTLPGGSLAVQCIELVGAIR
jgi:hypothetical protein